MNQHAVIDPQAVRQRAYERWQQRGCPADSAERDWFEAEQELARARSLRTQSKQPTEVLSGPEGLAAVAAQRVPRPRRPRSIITRSAGAPAARLLVALVPNARR